MNLEHELALYDAALSTWGVALQGMMLAEECAELGAATMQWLRGRKDVDDLLQEMVDVDIMLGQIRRAINDESRWERWRDWKLERLKNRLPEEALQEYAAKVVQP